VSNSRIRALSVVQNNPSKTASKIANLDGGVTDVSKHHCMDHFLSVTHFVQGVWLMSFAMESSQSKIKSQ
jgi:hypothetical protein